jgi:hypothetical protein
LNKLLELYDGGMSGRFHAPERMPVPEGIPPDQTKTHPPE